MYLKFKKEHPVGISKGQHAKVDDQIGKDFIKNKYAEEVTEEDYNQWVTDYKVNLASESKEVSKEAIKLNDKRENGSGELAPKTEKDKEKEEEKELKYHALTEDDLKDHSDNSKGFEVGDEVELNEDDALVIGADGLFIKKGNA